MKSNLDLFWDNIKSLNVIAFCMKGKEDFHDKFHVGLSLHSWQKGE